MIIQELSAAPCVVPPTPLDVDLGRVVDVQVRVASRATLALPFAPWRPVPLDWLPSNPVPTTGPLANATSVTDRCAWSGRPWGPTNRPALCARFAPAGRGAHPVASVIVGMAAEAQFTDALDFARSALDVALDDPADAILDIDTPNGGRVILDAEDERGGRRRLCTAAVDRWNGCACAVMARGAV